IGIDRQTQGVETDIISLTLTQRRDIPNGPRRQNRVVIRDPFENHSLRVDPDPAEARFLPKRHRLSGPAKGYCDIEGLAVQPARIDGAKEHNGRAVIARLDIKVILRRACFDLVLGQSRTEWTGEERKQKRQGESAGAYDPELEAAGRHSGLGAGDA